MHVSELAGIAAKLDPTKASYLEFVREPALSVGLYGIPVGGVDPQQPHTEDEVYYVVSGRGRIQVAEEEREVGPGSVVYVAANVAHRFHSVTERLQVLVFFAPAEYTRSGKGQGNASPESAGRM